jgi:hypothetical protein
MHMNSDVIILGGGGSGDPTGPTLRSRRLVPELFCPSPFTW